MTKDDIANQIETVLTESCDRCRSSRRLAITAVTLAGADIMIGATLYAANQIQHSAGAAIGLAAFSAALGLWASRRAHRAVQKVKREHDKTRAIPNHKFQTKDLIRTLENKRDHFAIAGIITAGRLASGATALSLEGYSLYRDPPQIHNSYDLLRLASTALTVITASMALKGLADTSVMTRRDHKRIQHIKAASPA